jgi:tol-pal system protein YbgF
MKNSFLSILFIFVFSFFLVHCVSTQPNGESGTENSSQKDGLDDIEQLLGITPDSETASNSQAGKSPVRGEELDLLETGAVSKDGGTTSSNAYMAAAMAEEANNADPKEIESLKNELKEKDKQISKLKTELKQKSEQINELSLQTGASTFGGSAGLVSPENYEATYNNARAAFENRNYETAIQQFESLLGSSAQHNLSDNAQYWIGESYYGKQQYNAAIIAFEKVFTFSNSNKRDDAQLKLGLCYIRKGDASKAKEELNRFLNDYPESEYIEKVKRILSDL